MSFGTIGGKVIFGSTPARWAFTSGVSPFKTTFDVSREDAAALVKGAMAPVTLILRGDVDPLSVENLYVTKQVPADVPALGRVEVVDRRYFWDRKSAALGFNMRRKTDIRRLSDPATLDQNQTIVANVAYMPWSLKGFTIPNSSTKVPWEAKSIIQEIVKRAGTIENDLSGAQPKVIFQSDAQTLASQLPIENLVLSGDYATMLEQMLDYIPGIGVYVNAKGDVVFYSKTDKSEAAMVVAAGPEKVNRGHVETVDLSRERPSKILVKFFREVELRFDYLETDSAPTTDGEPLTMENVLPIPDFSLSINGQTLPTGAWITIQQALTAWGSMPLVKGARRMTLADLQRASVPFNGLVEAIGAIGVTSVDANWVRRITTALQHYRRTYRIPRTWMDRIFRLRASRVATQDRATSARGKALAYSDYAYLGTTRSLYHDAASGRDMSYVANHPCFAANALFSAPTTLPTPGGVEIVDEEQGIIRLEIITDKAQVYGTVFPSQVELNGDNTTPGTQARFCGPTGNLAGDDPSRPRCWDILADPTRWPKLTSSHACAVVLTCQPGLGAWWDGVDPGQFTVIEVTPEKVGLKGVPCLGPPMEVLIGASMETARIAWLDSKASHIKACFGPPFQGTKAEVDALTLNFGPVPEGQIKFSDPGASLASIAAGAARRIYQTMHDRMQGSMTGTMVPSIHPQGWLSDVEHVLDPSGEVSTKLTLPPLVQALPLEAYLPMSVRRQLIHAAGTGT